MLHVIYVPGLGDKRVWGQRLAVSLWRLWGVRPQVFQMNWADGEAFEPKFQRLLQVIDAAQRRGSVALVGSSAGASAVINAYASRPTLQTVVCIAGKIHNPQTIDGIVRQQNPAFWESLQRTAPALAVLDDRALQRLLSIRARFDGLVPAEDSIVAGGQNRVSWTVGHPVTIGLQLVFGAPRLIRFMRAQTTTTLPKS